MKSIFAVVQIAISGLQVTLQAAVAATM